MEVQLCCSVYQDFPCYRMLCKQCQYEFDVFLDIVNKCLTRTEVHWWCSAELMLTAHGDKKKKAKEHQCETSSLIKQRNQRHVAEECSRSRAKAPGGGEWRKTSCWVTQSWVWAPSAECSSTLIMLINHSTPPTFSRTPITIYPHGRRRANSE